MPIQRELNALTEADHLLKKIGELGLTCDVLDELRALAAAVLREVVHRREL